MKKTFDNKKIYKISFSDFEKEILYKARASRTVAEDERLLWEKVAATVRPFHLVRSSTASTHSSPSEHFPKIKTRFSDKNYGETQELEQPPKTEKQLLDRNGQTLQPRQPLQQNGTQNRAQNPVFVTLQDALKGALPLLDSKDRQKIARGSIKMEARLDLHGLDSASAHALLLQFISHAASIGKKHVLIITGKGNSFKKSADKNGRLRREEGERQGGVLRQSVPLWLETAPFRPYVSAVEEAARHHGGSGALYVRLRQRKAAGS